MGDTEEIVETYHRYTFRKILFILFCLVVAFIALGISVSIGTNELSIQKVYEIIFKHIMGAQYEVGSPEYVDDSDIWDFRLPRALFAILAGAALAVAGVAMQSVMNNPLADPYTTGISSGACFGVSVSIILGFNLISIPAVSNFATVINAFVFALIPMIAILVIAPRLASSPATLILAGVAISYIFNSFNTLLMVATEEETLAQVYTWQVGTLENINWSCVPLVAVTTLIGVAVVFLLSNKLNILSLGEDSAKSLGVNVRRLQIVLLCILSFMAAAVISFTGIIGFIGLVTPHLVRLLIDSDNRYVVPASALFSASLLSVCDILCRLVSPNGQIPVGVIISFVGAPLFLYLLVRRNSNVW